MNDAPGKYRRPQFGLLTLLLLVAVAAVWLAYLRTDADLKRLTSLLPGLRALNREFTVEDPRQFTTVGKIPEWYGEEVGEIWVPAGKSYAICMALDGIQVQPHRPEPEVQTPIAAGKHSIEFVMERRADDSTFAVKLNGEIAISAIRPKEWESQNGYSGGANLSRLRQHEGDAPWELFRRRFMVSTGKNTSSTPQGPGPGMLVWIEELGEK